MANEPGVSDDDEPTEQIRLVDLETTTVPGGALFSMPPRVLGFKIFRWLLWLVVGLISLLMLYGYMTYPRIDEVRSLTGSGPEALQAFSIAKSDWLASVKDLGQIFLVTPFVPLLSAVLGYMFGRNEPGTNDDTGE